VIAHLAGQRTHEIGVRLALGAQSKDILMMVPGEGLLVALVGVGTGILAALALRRLIIKMISREHAADPITYLGVAILLTLIGIAACYFPARRAMRVGPIHALRYE
jgi:putative ABC transport system permease protein